MSTTKEHHNLWKIVLLVMEHGTEVLKEKLRKELLKEHKTLQDLVKASRHKLLHLHSLKRCCECTSYPTARHSAISYKQLMLLFDNDREQVCNRPNKDKNQLCTCGFKEKSDISENDMDITLLSCFLINIIKLNETDKKLIKKLRDERNMLFHLKSAKVPSEEFEPKFQNIAHVINEIAKGFDTELFATVRSQMIDLESSGFFPQQLPDAMTLNVEPLVTEQTNREETRSQSFEQYLCSLTSESLIGFPESVRKHLKDIVDQFDSPTEEEKKTRSSTLISRLQSEIEMTSTTLVQHVSPENVFQDTQQLQDSFHVLDTKHVVVLHGIAGSGKTTLAREVLYLMRDEYTPIILSNPDQLRGISQSDKVVVFLDDILGRSAYSGDAASRWYQMFDTMYILSRQGSPRFILAFRENVFTEFRQDTDVFHSKLFCDESLVNVSCMTSSEKEALFEKHCIHNGVSLYYGTGDTPVKQSSKSLDRNTFKQICITQPLTGFPQCCFLFFANKIFFEMGENFFKRPDKSLISKVDQLRKSQEVQYRLQYALLAYMMLMDDSVDPHALATNANFEKIIDDLGLKGITSSMLIDCVEGDTVRSLLQVVDGKDRVVFQHQTIKEAVFISFSKHFPDKILQNSNLQLIKDFFRSKAYARKVDEVVVTLHESCFTTLSSRLIDEIIQKNNSNLCVKLQVFEDNNFAKTFVDTLLTFVTDVSDANDIIKRLLLCSSEHGTNELLSELLRVCIVYDDNDYNSNTVKDDLNISMTFFREEMLSTAMRKGHVNVISSIVKKERTVLYRSKCGLLPVHTAIWTGIRPVCDILWSEYGEDTTCMSSCNDRSGRRCVHFCAIQGYIDKIREIKSHGEEYVMAKDAQNQSALHYAVQGGQYHILHELLGYGLCITDRRTKDNHSVLQVLLLSLDFEKRCETVCPVREDIMRAISGDNSVLWNSDHYRTLEYILELPDVDLNDLDVIIDSKHSYNVAHYACIDDARSVVSRLLKERRTLFLKRNSTRYPMIWDIAVFLGRFFIFKTLLENGLIHDEDKSRLVRTVDQGRKQAFQLKFVDRRLLLKGHEREKIWPGCCFPFVIFGQECDYDNIVKLLK